MSQVHRGVACQIFISEIDAEHKILTRLIGELESALNSRARIPAGLLQSLVSHFHDHFAHEERLMRQSRYDAFPWHKQQHDGARRRTRQLVRLIEQGDRHAGAEMLEYVTGWLKGHVAVTDRMMAAYLRNYSRRHAA